MFAFTGKRLIALLAVVLSLGAVIGLSACSGSSQPATPPSATSVLQGDGYTYDSAISSEVQTGLGTEPGLSSLAVGEQGSNVQLVMVLTSPSEASAAASGVQSQYAGQGITVASNGDVLTATGSLSSFAALDG